MEPEKAVCPHGVGMCMQGCLCVNTQVCAHMFAHACVDSCDVWLCYEYADAYLSVFIAIVHENV